MKPSPLFKVWIIALFVLSFSNVYSQEVMIKGKYPDSKNVYWNDIFLMNGAATFYLINTDLTPVELEQCTWETCLLINKTF